MVPKVVVKEEILFIVWSWHYPDTKSRQDNKKKDCKAISFILFILRVFYNMYVGPIHFSISSYPLSAPAYTLQMKQNFRQKRKEKEIKEKT